MRVDAKLAKICAYRKETIDVSKADTITYISTENMRPNKGGVKLASSIPLKGNVSRYYPGDTLVSNIRPYFKKIWYATMPGSCSNDILVLRPNGDCLNEYLYYLLSDDRFFEYATATAKGTKMPRGDKVAIMNYPINQVGIEQQKAIVAILKPLQTSINLNNRINDYLVEIGVALFNNTCPQTNDPNATLSDVAAITMGQSPSGSSYNEDGKGEVFYQGRGEFGTYFPRRRLFTTEPKRMAQEGDILMSVRAPVGDLNVANEKCCIGRGLAAIHSDSVQSFVHYLMRGQARQLNAYNGDGTVFGSISGKALKELLVFLPAEDTITRLEAQLSTIDTMVRRNDDETQILEQMRDTLLPKLMSGEIDVSKIHIS